LLSAILEDSEIIPGKSGDEASLRVAHRDTSVHQGSFETNRLLVRLFSLTILHGWFGLLDVLPAATLAPAIKAFDGSVMRPVSVALVDWALRTGVNDARSSKARAGTRPISVEPLPTCYS